jgi:hypothetical protein
MGRFIPSGDISLVAQKIKKNQELSIKKVIDLGS